MEALSRAAEGIGPVKPGNLCPASVCSREKRCYILQIGSGLKDEETINETRMSSLFFQRRGFYDA